MSAPIRLAVHGAAGRMGRRVVALALEDVAFRLVAAIDRPGSPGEGEDAGRWAGAAAAGVALSDRWPAELDAVIDFSLPEAIDAVLERALERSVPLVIATTGLDAAAQQRIAAAAERLSIVWAPSMSPAVNLTMRLAQQAARTLRDVPGGVDVEILERHHRFKEDAPSGTALKFGQLIADQLAGKPAGEPAGSAEKTVGHVHGRHGATGARPRHEIGYHAIRAGDNPGEHTILFGMLGETVELRVAASNRDCYASGALAAARWLQDRPAGLYSMFDVLGLNER